MLDMVLILALGIDIGQTDNDDRTQELLRDATHPNPGQSSHSMEADIIISPNTKASPLELALATEES